MTGKWKSMSEIHSLVRTSPKGKGQKFVGVCTRCGQEGLTLADVNEECSNVRGVSAGAALVEILAGPRARH